MDTQKTAQHHRAEIARLKAKIDSIAAERDTRAEALDAERAALAEQDRATLEKLSALRLDPDVSFEAVSFAKVPGATNAGPDLLRGLAQAREALPIVVDTLEYRIANGSGPDAQLAQLGDCLSRVRAELSAAEGAYQAAQDAARAWLAE